MTIKAAMAMVEEANAQIETIGVDEARKLIDDDGVLFVDVRETIEWDKGHLPGAVHVPRGLLEFLADPSSPMHEPELAADRRLVLYCASGGRSALAARTLGSMGYTGVCHVAGGINAWREAGHPTTDGT